MNHTCACGVERLVESVLMLGEPVRVALCALDQCEPLFFAEDVHRVKARKDAMDSIGVTYDFENGDQLYEAIDGIDDFEDL